MSSQSTAVSTWTFDFRLVYGTKFTLDRSVVLLTYEYVDSMVDSCTRKSVYTAVPREEANETLLEHVKTLLEHVCTY